MNFELESWEIPPGAAADNLSVPIEFGPVNWNGEQTMVSARAASTNAGKSSVLFRPHSDEFNYAVLINDDFGEFKAQLRGPKLERIARKAMSPKKFFHQSGRFYFGRVFHVQGQCCLVRAGESFWARTKSWLSHTPIEFPFEIATEPSAKVFNWLWQQWQDANSATRLSWDWNQKEHAERDKWLAEAMPAWGELHQLMRAITMSIELAPDLWWPRDDLITFELDYTPAQLAHLEVWDKLLQAHFPFEPLPGTAPLFLREYFPIAFNNISVQGSEFSAHQQLEAKFYLRDWLRNHAPEHLHLVQ